MKKYLKWVPDVFCTIGLIAIVAAVVIALCTEVPLGVVTGLVVLGGAFAVTGGAIDEALKS